MSKKNFNNIVESTLKEESVFCNEKKKEKKEVKENLSPRVRVLRNKLKIKKG